MVTLGFVLMCAGVFAGLLIAAILLEKFVCKDRKPFSNTHYVSYTAIFAAMAAVLMFFEFPLPFIAPPFYEIDLSEIPIMICTFYLGPVSGVVAELLKVILKLLLKGTSTAFVGDFANFAVGCAMVLPASVIYHARPGKKTAITGLVVGTLIMSVFGSAFNAFYLIPAYVRMFMPLEAIISAGQAIHAGINSVGALVLLCVAPFNIIKGVIVSLLTMLLYKRISPILHKGDKKRSAARAEAK